MITNILLAVLLILGVIIVDQLLKINSNVRALYERIHDYLYQSGQSHWADIHPKKSLKNKD